MWVFELSFPDVYISNCSIKILGPFPIHAREQHYLSQSFPLNCRHNPQDIIWHASLSFLVSEPLDFNKSWPSSYADGGRVTWCTAKADLNGYLKVSFPHIRWVYVIFHVPMATSFSSTDGNLLERQKDGLHCNTTHFSIPLWSYTHLRQGQDRHLFRIFSFTFHKGPPSLSSLPLITLNVRPGCPNGIPGTYMTWNVLFPE